MAVTGKHITKINKKPITMNIVYKYILEICNPHFVPLNIAEHSK
jgi:hypothetical protein